MRETRPYGRPIEASGQRRTPLVVRQHHGAPQSLPETSTGRHNGFLSVTVGIGVTEAAKRLAVSRKQLSDVLNGHSGILPEMAIRLDKAFGGGAETWYRLQAAYDLARAMKRANDIKVERITRAA
jgi:addiction module HigA family antidote